MNEYSQQFPTSTEWFTGNEKFTTSWLLQIIGINSDAQFFTYNRWKLKNMLFKWAGSCGKEREVAVWMETEIFEDANFSFSYKVIEKKATWWLFYKLKMDPLNKNWKDFQIFIKWKMKIWQNLGHLIENGKNCQHSDL